MKEVEYYRYQQVNVTCSNNQEKLCFYKLLHACVRIIIHLTSITFLFYSPPWKFHAQTDIKLSETKLWYHRHLHNRSHKGMRQSSKWQRAKLTRGHHELGDDVIHRALWLNSQYFPHSWKVYARLLLHWTPKYISSTKRFLHGHSWFISTATFKHLLITALLPLSLENDVTLTHFCEVFLRLVPCVTLINIRTIVLSPL